MANIHNSNHYLPPSLMDRSSTGSSNSTGRVTPGTPTHPHNDVTENQFIPITPPPAVTPDLFSSPPRKPATALPSAVPPPVKKRKTIKPITIEYSGHQYTFRSVDEIVSFFSIPSTCTPIQSGDCCKVFLDGEHVYKYLSGNNSTNLSDLLDFVANEVQTSIEISNYLSDINLQLRLNNIQTSFSIPLFARYNPIIVKSPFISGTPLGSMTIETLDSILVLTLIETGADILLTDTDRAYNFIANLRSNIRSFLTKLYPEILSNTILKDLPIDSLIPDSYSPLLNPQQIKQTVKTFFTTNHLGSDKAAIDTTTSILYLAYYLKDQGIIIDCNPNNFIATAH